MEDTAEDLAVEVALVAAADAAAFTAAAFMEVHTDRMDQDTMVVAAVCFSRSIWAAVA